MSDEEANYFSQRAVEVKFAALVTALNEERLLTAELIARMKELQEMYRTGQANLVGTQIIPTS